MARAASSAEYRWFKTKLAASIFNSAEHVRCGRFVIEYFIVETLSPHLVSGIIKLRQILVLGM
ncbi:outer capsid VP7 [Vibrio furnissii NCTC 11218]|nr:outer capsid VP7 [Vibrio furnissii NCTC 11218]